MVWERAEHLLVSTLYVVALNYQLMVTLVHAADMNRVYARQFRNDPCFSERYNSPHCPQSPFILHDFIGYILRASHLLYGHRTDLSLHEHGLAACLAWFFKTDVMEGKLKREREKSQRELMEDDLYWVRYNIILSKCAKAFAVTI